MSFMSIYIYKSHSLKIHWTIVSWPLQRTTTAMLGTITNIGGTGIMMNSIAWWSCSCSIPEQVVVCKEDGRHAAGWEIAFPRDRLRCGVVAWTQGFESCLVIHTSISKGSRFDILLVNDAVARPQRNDIQAGRRESKDPINASVRIVFCSASNVEAEAAWAY